LAALSFIEVGYKIRKMLFLKIPFRYRKLQNV